ncbi:MAG: hypothetical protein K6T74_08445 [Geminicoccaceae bacterium]|nr:hypothetical protein [Geminicoccaceae bacterium]
MPCPLRAGTVRFRRLDGRDRTARLARNRLFRWVRTPCAEENGPVLALLRRQAARIVVDPPEARARLPLLPPTPATLLLEALDLGELLRERLLPGPGAAAMLGLGARPNGDQA